MRNRYTNFKHPQSKILKVNQIFYSRSLELYHWCKMLVLGYATERLQHIPSRGLLMADKMYNFEAHGFHINR